MRALARISVKKNMSKKKRESYTKLAFSTALDDYPLMRVLDQSLLIGALEFTVSVLAEATELSYKTVKSCLDHLQEIGWVKPTRILGNAQAYKFSAENHMSGLIRWATEYQLANAADQAGDQAKIIA